MALGSSAVAGRVSPAVAVAGVVGLGWVAGGFERGSMPSKLAVLLVGAAVVLAGLRRPPPEPDGEGPVDGVRAWAALFVALALWEAYAFFQQPAPTVASFDHPTLSTLADPVLDSQVVRTLGLLAWLWSGLALVRR